MIRNFSGVMATHRLPIQDCSRPKTLMKPGQSNRRTGMGEAIGEQGWEAAFKLSKVVKLSLINLSNLGSELMFRNPNIYPL